MNPNDKEIWVFLSHSNEDYDKVRLVRNMLEEQHMRPIMFFLKCLNDNDEEEIFSLIKREIDSRTRFILCDSPNARKSTWVQREVNYMKQKERRFQTIDLTKSEEEIISDLLSFNKKYNMYISYSNHADFANDFIERLSKYDVRISPSVSGYENCVDTWYNLYDSIGELSFLGGTFVGLVSKAYIDSRWAWDEAIAAERCKCDMLFFAVEPDIKDYKWLNRHKIVPYTNVKLIDSCLEMLLTYLFDAGSILAFADDFNKGNGRKKDLKEAEFCFNLYIRKTVRTDKPYAALSVARCYSQGRGTNIDLIKSYEYYRKVVIDGQQFIKADEMEEYKKEMLAVYNRMSEEEKRHVRKHFPEQM